jgi:hypothetical protein
MNTNFIIRNAEYVEVVIPTGNTKQTIYFPDLPNLRNRQIMGMETFSASEQFTTSSGATVQSSGDFPNVTVTLYFDGGEYIVCPLYAFKRIGAVQGGVTAYFESIPQLAGQNIVWTKSYVSMNANVANYAGKSFLFNVYYNR